MKNRAYNALALTIGLVVGVSGTLLFGGLAGAYGLACLAVGYLLALLVVENEA